MSYIPKTCLDCGANLDPGERCDCEDSAEIDSFRGIAALIPKEGWPVTNVEEIDGGVKLTVERRRLYATHTNAWREP